MKRNFLTVALLVVLMVITFSGCPQSTNGKTENGGITVTSTSIVKGKLITATAANNAANDPTGENKSPQLSWNNVPAATCFAVVMFDTTANWLH